MSLSISEQKNDTLSISDSTDVKTINKWSFKNQKWIKLGLIVSATMLVLFLILYFVISYAQNSKKRRSSSPTPATPTQECLRECGSVEEQHQPPPSLSSEASSTRGEQKAFQTEHKQEAKEELYKQSLQPADNFKGHGALVQPSSLPKTPKEGQPISLSPSGLQQKAVSSGADSPPPSIAKPPVLPVAPFPKPPPINLSPVLNYAALPLFPLLNPPANRRIHPLDGRHPILKGIKVAPENYKAYEVPGLESATPQFCSNVQGWTIPQLLLGQPYHIVIEQQTVEKLKDYLRLIKGVAQGTAKDKNVPGHRFLTLAIPRLGNKALQDLTLEDLFQGLCFTRYAFKTAESVTNWYDYWNYQEVSLMGDVSVVVHALAIDDGSWHGYHQRHANPLPVTMGFVSGCLGLNKHPDFDEFYSKTANGVHGLVELYTRRLLPVLRSFSDQLLTKDSANGMPLGTSRGIVTIPGIGTNFFARDFNPADAIIDTFVNVVRYLVRAYGHQFSNLDLWLDMFKTTHSEVVGDICTDGTRASLFIRALNDSRCPGVQQMMPPQVYASYIQDVYGVNRVYAHLFTVIAWDHYAWPGNDWLIYSRMSDDGNKGASTTALYSMTGHVGYYDGLGYRCKGWPNWREMVKKQKLRIWTKGRTIIYNRQGGAPTKLQ